MSGIERPYRYAAAEPMTTGTTIIHQRRRRIRRMLSGVYFVPGSTLPLPQREPESKSGSEDALCQMSGDTGGQLPAIEIVRVQVIVGAEGPGLRERDAHLRVARVCREAGSPGERVMTAAVRSV